MEVIKKKASEDYIRIWEANACLENLFGVGQRQVRVCEALGESVMYELQSPGIKEVEKILGGADPWDLERRRERRFPARGEHHGGRERDPLLRDAGVMRYPPSALPRATTHGATDENARDRRDSSDFTETRMKMSSGVYLRQPTLHPSRNGAERPRLHFSKRTNPLTNCFCSLFPPNVVFVIWKLLQFPPRRRLKRASTAARHDCSPACPMHVVSGALPREPGVLPLTKAKVFKPWAITQDGVLGNSQSYYSPPQLNTIVLPVTG